MNKRVRNGLSGALWMFTIVLFLFGVLNGYAAIVWLIFLVVAGFQSLIEAFYKPNKGY